MDGAARVDDAAAAGEVGGAGGAGLPRESRGLLPHFEQPSPPATQQSSLFHRRKQIPTHEYIVCSHQHCMSVSVSDGVFNGETISLHTRDAEAAKEGGKTHPSSHVDMSITAHARMQQGRWMEGKAATRLTMNGFPRLIRRQTIDHRKERERERT